MSSGLCSCCSRALDATRWPDSSWLSSGRHYNTRDNPQGVAREAADQVACEAVVEARRTQQAAMD
jgi:hypothetical protein